MAALLTLSPEEIRARRADTPKTRDRDFAATLGISEAQLVAAHVGHGVTPVLADLDATMSIAMDLGEVMALTRNESCVHEKVGVYGNYRNGPHAGMIFNGDIDLRMFPKHWQHAFMVERAVEGGLRRSLQIFDAAGDAVHKIFLRDEAYVDAWEQAKRRNALPDPVDHLEVTPRTPTPAPKGDPAKAEIIREEWTNLTDTHQFMGLMSRLKMNRLGAYHIAGEPFVQQLDVGAVAQMFAATQAQGLAIMVFVGNMGCIQIHSGPIHTLKPMGPWLNVLDPGFNLHLRMDHIAEVWAVDKPTRDGPAISVEAFDADGGVIFQAFGVGRGEMACRPQWNDLVATLPRHALVEA
ncbi:hemin-degrading factor [Epibacterium ulvae]|uniref:hemin-degrading factor n=1 Tax=Epibacterium ulvae TaxID=1156985 RepID=UPI001BFC9611|nr:ChuX/HutX family heme-like substrate-binding protein [Epibacterium ulvae]MBT8155626.1 hemin-degrading factor [Epibacterium ulvae]